MKQTKRVAAIVLSVLMILEIIPVNAWADGSVSKNENVLSTADGAEYIYGTGNGITRAEWIHNLKVLFEMSVEDESDMPDNYFIDIEGNIYYKDIMLAVEFGVINIEAGNAFEPSKPASREFAAHTLNYYLGYESDENTEYTFSGVSDVTKVPSSCVGKYKKLFELQTGFTKTMQVKK